MTIEVQSNDTAADVAVNAPKEVKAAETTAAVETKSAPESKETEQKEIVSESETETTEEKEETEELEALKEGETETKEKTGEPAKKKGGFQRRIDKLNAAKATAQQETEYWKNLELKSAVDPKTDPKVEPTKAKAEAGKPDPSKFDTHAAYVEALTDWKTDQKLSERDQKDEQKKAQTAQAKVVETYVERKNAFAEKAKDFDEVVSEVDDIQMSSAFREIVLTSENGPELAYELAKNREEYARVNKLPPLAAAREMGKLEAKLSKPSETKTKETKTASSAPKPIAPVGGGGKASAPPKTLEEAAKHSFAEFKRLREAELKTKGKRA